MVRYILTLVFLAFTIQSCSSEEVSQFSDRKTIWVFAQFNVPEEKNQIDTFWYYGRISKPLYDKFSTNKIQQGFILLRDVHYWGNDDLIHQYKDDENTGELLFKIEDIKRMRRVHTLPKNSEEHTENLTDEKLSDDK